MTEKRIHGLLALGALMILWLGYQANPQFLRFEEHSLQIVPMPPLAPSSQFKKLPSNCGATDQYRHNPQRTGVAPSSAQPKAKVSIYKQIRPLNVGIHNASKASPAIDQSGVYVGSDTGWFFKMDFEGHILWRFYIPGSANGIHGTAALDSKKVYIGAYNGFMYALDKSSGELVWANPVGHFIGASPLLADGALYIAAETNHPDGLLAKLDCNSGETLWRSQWLGGHAHSSPTYDESNDQVVVGANSGRFFAFKAGDGSLSWETQLRGQIKGTPMIWDGTAYFSSWDQNFHGYDLKSGQKRWEQFMGGRLQTSLTLVPGKQLGITNTRRGDLTGLHLPDGEILWRLRHGDSNNQFSVLVTQDPLRPGEFLAWSRCKRYQLCTLDGATGKLLHRVDLPGSFTGVPVAWKDRIYIALDENQGLVILK